MAVHDDGGVLVVRSVDELRAVVRDARREGSRIGFVPTMGYLHDGHLSLIRRAVAECDVAVTSIFVNPTQFNDPADLAAYPRDEAHDLELARAAGCTIAFLPSVHAVYPPGFATTVRIDGPITEALEGAVRGPQHFWGVATVVAKLFSMVAPDAAFFGQKDAQQCVVVRRLITDLDLPIELVVCPTLREPDGLAMSSRNVRLGPADRQRAVALIEALRAAELAVTSGTTTAEDVRVVATKAMLDRGVVPEYVAVVDPSTFAALDCIQRRALVLVAAEVGPVRLIDNLFVERGTV
ncbi:MAG: pantoate--beta-alanine ligase [Ilumatobacteraceae bacterium]